MPGIGCSPPAYQCYPNDQRDKPAGIERKRWKKKRRKGLKKTCGKKMEEDVIWHLQSAGNKTVLERC
jgi:hypothetical protein